MASCYLASGHPQPPLYIGHNFMRQNNFFFLLWRCGPTRAMASTCLRFLDHTRRRIKSEGHLWTSDQFDAETSLTTHNTHNRETSMPPAGFETTVSAGESSRTYALRSGHTERGLPQRTAVSVRCEMLHSKQTLLTIIF